MVKYEQQNSPISSLHKNLFSWIVFSFQIQLNLFVFLRSWQPWESDLTFPWKFDKLQLARYMRKRWNAALKFQIYGPNFLVVEFMYHSFGFTKVLVNFEAKSRKYPSFTVIMSETPICRSPVRARGMFSRASSSPDAWK